MTDPPAELSTELTYRLMLQPRLLTDLRLAPPPYDLRGPGTTSNPLWDLCCEQLEPKSLKHGCHFHERTGASPYRDTCSVRPNGGSGNAVSAHSLFYCCLFWYQLHPLALAHGTGSSFDSLRCRLSLPLRSRETARFRSPHVVRSGRET